MVPDLGRPAARTGSPRCHASRRDGPGDDQRQRAETATGEVAMAGRFVALTEPEPNSELTDSVTLLVHDIRTNRTLVVASGVAEVHAYGTMLWWSIGTANTRR